jgi:hypothetical protein
MLDTLNDGATAIETGVARSSLRWHAQVKPLWLIGYTLWTAATVGLTAAAVVPNRDHPRAYLLVPVVLLLSLALSVGTMVLSHRRQRWLRSKVAAEVRGEMTKIRHTWSDASNRPAGLRS